MTMQVQDMFIWKEKEYNFISATDVYALFDPKKFGFNPKMITTACYKGFNFQIIVNEKDGLALDRLEILDANDNYPQINGVNALKGDNSYTYNKINLPLNNYSGTIIIGKDLKETKAKSSSCFISPSDYSTTYELKIEGGKVTEYQNTSGLYEQRRKKFLQKIIINDDKDLDLPSFFKN